MIALEVEGLDAFYGKSQVAFGLGVVVREGETVAVLGRNGAGKTSTLKAIAGVIAHRCDRLAIGGRDVSRLPPFRRVRAGLALVPSGSRAFPNLTVHENLGLAARARRRSSAPPQDARKYDEGRRERRASVWSGRSTRLEAPHAPSNASQLGWSPARVYEVFPVLASLRDSPAGSLSGGERQMLAVGRALVARPKVLMLDEPSEGLAPMIVRQIGVMLRELSQQGLAVLLTEQNHRLALDTADRAYFIEKGQIVWEGDAAQAGQPGVIGRYLAV